VKESYSVYLKECVLEKASVCVGERETQREGRKRRERTRRLDNRDYSGVCVDGEDGNNERKKDDKRQ